MAHGGWGAIHFLNQVEGGGKEIFDATLGGASRFLADCHSRHGQMSRKFKCREMVNVTNRLTPRRGANHFLKQVEGEGVQFF